MTYRVRVTRTGRSELRRLPGHVRQRFIRLIDLLAEDPVPPGAKELRGLPGRYRIRLLKWRLIYRVEGEKEEIWILAIRQKAGPETYQNVE